MKRALAVVVLAVPAIAAADPLVVVPRYAPHAHPPRRVPLQVETPADGEADYYYVAYGQAIAMSGAGATFTVAQPQVSTLDYHSLAEISVESADENQIIEIGWNIDPGVNPGSVSPHLFSFHWINGAGTCYNACGWVQVSQTHAPGMQVPADDAPHTFQIEHRADARWWLTYDGDDMGYYPDTEWTNPPYTEGGFTQWFGEVAAGSEASPCTQMGNGLVASDGSAALFADIYRETTGNTHIAASVSKTAITLPAAYSSSDVANDTFHFGGPGIATPGCQYDTDMGQTVEGGPFADDLPLVDGPPDAGNGETGSAGAGCCDAGGSSGGTALVGIGLGALVLRRRR